MIHGVGGRLLTKNLSIHSVDEVVSDESGVLIITRRCFGEVVTIPVIP